MKHEKGIKAKYFLMPKAVKASFWLVICSIIQRGISMITAPIFTRILTTEQYGLFTVYSSWYTILRVFATLSLDTGGFNKAMIEFKEDKDAYTASMIGLTTVSSVFFGVVFSLLNFIFGDFTGLSYVLLAALVFEMLFNSATAIFTARKRFEYEYKEIAGITFAISAFCPIVGIIAVLFTDKYRGQARIISYVMVQVIVGLFVYIRILRKEKIWYRFSYWKYALSFNLPLIPHFLSMNVLGQSDRIMIGKISGNSDAAIYGIAYMIAQLMIIVVDAVTNSLTPYTYKSIHEENYEKLNKITLALLVFIAMCMVLMICIGPEIIKIFAPYEYYSARWVIPPVAVSVYFIFLYPVFTNVEFYYGYRIFVAISSTLCAILNIFLNYNYIKRYGFVAAGYTTLICYVVLTMIHYIFYRQVMKRKLSGISIYDGKRIGIVSLALGMFLIVIVPLYDCLLVRYLIVFFVLFLCCLNRRKIIQNIIAMRE